MPNRNGTQIEDRGYDPGERLTSVDRAFTDETRTYDAANRLTSISNTGVGQTTYSWDANGNKLGETWDGSMAAWSFTTQKSGASQFVDGYDADDRFRRFIRSGQNEDRDFDRSMIGNIFDIDTNGNHTPRTFGLAHELTAIAIDPQSFDAKGNVTQIPGSLRGMTSDILLSWDFDNRLKSSTADSTITDYGYDALGRRVSKESVVFVYGGAGQQNCIAEYASAAAPTSPDREFVYGDSIDSLVLISDTNDTRRLLATRNQQWSVVALVDLSDGSVVERYTYDVFGARRVLDASGAEISGSGQYGMSASQYGNPYGYTSRRHDLESGLMYFRARMYDPTTGEFLSRDPLGYVDGMSLYRACFVPGAVDPSGKKCRIRVRCWDVIRLGAKLNIHCGVEIESDVPPFNKGTGPIVSVDGTDAGDHTGVVFADPAVEEGLQDLPGERTGDWEKYDDGVCKCLALRGKLFREFKVPYENLANETGPDEKPIANPTNSNFAFKCFTKPCGIKVPDWAKNAYGYNSVYRRECGVWVDEAGCRRCVETVAECPWDVPVIVSVR